MAPFRSIILIYRHGDRSPFATYPNDLIPESAWPQGFQQLSTVGMQQHYALGQYFRRYYSGFLNSSYLANEVYVLSTDTDRTLMSAQMNLAGLYPPEDNQVWNTTIPWQPIPVHVDSALNPVMSQPLNCQRLMDLLATESQSTFVHNALQKNKGLYQYIAEHTGTTWDDMAALGVIADSIFCKRMNNVTLPSWANSTVYTEMLRVLDRSAYTSESLEIRHLISGPLLSEITDHMRLKVNDDSSALKHKLYMYSAHDVTLTGLFSALNISNWIQPPYTATILLELYQQDSDSDEDFYVQIKYKNDSGDPHLLNIPGCHEKCPFNQFLSLTSVDLLTACKSNTTRMKAAADDDNIFHKTNMYTLLIPGAIGLIVGNICTLLCIYFIKKQYCRRKMVPDRDLTYKYSHLIDNED